MTCLVLLAAVAVSASTYDMGIVHSDEIYQFQEPAFYMTYGRGFVPWEWHVGLRSWFAPGLLGRALQVMKALRIEDVTSLRLGFALMVGVMHLLSLHALYRMTTRRTSSGRAALAATAAYALLPCVIVFGARTMSETLSTAALLIAFDALDGARARNQDAWKAGAFLALAVGFRYGALAGCAGAGLWTLVALPLRRSVRVSLGAALTLLAFGILDRWTWGGYFHSFIEYVKYNVLSDQAAKEFGQETWRYYVPILLTNLTPVFWFALPSVRLRSALRDPLFISALTYAAATFWATHKEVRFFYPIVALFSAWGVVTAARMLARMKKAPLIALSCAVLMIAAPRALPESDLSLRATHQTLFKLQSFASAQCRNVALSSHIMFLSGGSMIFGPNVHLRYFDRSTAIPLDEFDCIFTMDSPPAISRAGFRAVDRGDELLFYKREAP